MWMKPPSWTYLNALALLSPSLVEGFGIKVLDAACLGIPALASSCDAHREIHDLFDFRDYVLPTILETRDWAVAMQATASRRAPGGCTGTGTHAASPPLPAHEPSDRRPFRRSNCPADAELSLLVARLRHAELAKLILDAGHLA